MIPLKDRNPSHRFPGVTIVLILGNVAVFLYQFSLGPAADAFVLQFGMIPSAISAVIGGSWDRVGAMLTIFTSLFLHGGWMHLIGNMLYLWVFGDNVEDKLGHGRYLLFYLICGISASALHIAIEPASLVPTIGASGAVSGVLAAYLVMFPRARVLTLIPIFIFIQLAEIPAFVLLGLWFVLQFFNGLVSLGLSTSGMGGVAWWAHIGGFAVGLLLVLPFRKYR